MKRYRVNRLLFLVLPLLVTTVIVLYMVILYRKSFYWVNIVNIGFDVVILMYYLVKFCYGVSSDGENLFFYTVFKNYRVPYREFDRAVYSSFMVKAITSTTNFYILISPKSRYIIKEILKDDLSSK